MTDRLARTREAALLVRVTSASGPRAVDRTRRNEACHVGAHVTGRQLDPALLAELASVDTPTICNAIEAFKARDDSEGFMGARIRCLPRAGGWPAMR